MNVLILGGDGYLGWPTAARFAAQGHNVIAVDNYLRRSLAEATDSEGLFGNPSLSERCRILHTEKGLRVDRRILDLSDLQTVLTLFAETSPDVIIHYAEQPSAPYSMMDNNASVLTLNNNLNVTLNVLLAMVDVCPEAHLVKLGTMGEYGTPNIDIEEGWLDIEHNGRKDRLLFPRAAGSLYHTTKVLDTDLIWFYVRTHGLRVTDLMQGPVYGIITPELAGDDRLLPHFNYDDIFGTVVNRFMVQAIAGVPLTVYGAGGQTRGYLNLLDTLQCVELAASEPAGAGELRILNQFTETFTVNELADHVVAAGKLIDIDVEVRSIANPRKEAEEHYYNPANSGLLELGLEPTYLTPELLAEMMSVVNRFKDSIERSRIMPRVKWA